MRPLRSRRKRRACIVADDEQEVEAADDEAADDEQEVEAEEADESAEEEGQHDGPGSGPDSPDEESSEDEEKRTCDSEAACECETRCEEERESLGIVRDAIHTAMQRNADRVKGKDELVERLKASCIPQPYKREYTQLAQRLAAEGADRDDKLAHKLQRALSIPFGKYAELPPLQDTASKRALLERAQRGFDRAAYGLKHAKEQMLNILAQMISAADGSHISRAKPRVLCLTGAAGCGKSLLATRGMKAALGRPCVSFAMGSVADSQYFLGCQYFWQGSHQGALVDALVSAGVMNPTLVFDEVDKVCESSHGKGVINMLMHLTDPLQNEAIKDAYFSPMPVDFSACPMVFLCNDPSKIHPVLRDRMHFIYVEAHSHSDKLHISRDFLWPEVLQQLGLSTAVGQGRLHLLPATFEYLVKRCVAEGDKEDAGMRSMKRQMETIALYCNTAHLLGKMQLPLRLDVEGAKRILTETKHHCKGSGVEALSVSVQNMYI